jgi:hypothetical protein
MGRETTLRQLIYMCNKEILKNEGMTRTELHEITDWVFEVRHNLYTIRSHKIEL